MIDRNFTIRIRQSQEIEKKFSTWQQNKNERKFFDFDHHFSMEPHVFVTNLDQIDEINVDRKSTQVLSKSRKLSMKKIKQKAETIKQIQLQL